MKTYFVLVVIATYFGLTTISLEARQVSTLHADIVRRTEENLQNFNETLRPENSTDGRVARQEEEGLRPYEYVPRVFHSLRRIIKGVLNGSIHEVLHGSFSFAPQEVGNEIIGVYNQVVGIGETTEAPFNATLEELLEEEFEEEA